MPMPLLIAPPVTPTITCEPCSNNPRANRVALNAAPFMPPRRFKFVSTGRKEVFNLRYALDEGLFGNSVAFIEKEFGEPTYDS